MIMTINSTEIRKLEHQQQQVYKSFQASRSFQRLYWPLYSIYFRSETS